MTYSSKYITDLCLLYQLKQYSYSYALSQFDMFLAQIVHVMVTPSPRPYHDGTPAEIIPAQINPLPPLPIYTLLIFFILIMSFLFMFFPRRGEFVRAEIPPV
jgi:hypothetical protein